MSETYLERIKCPNCGFDEDFNIPKGTTIIMFKMNQKCGKCGCGLYGWN